MKTEGLGALYPKDVEVIHADSLDAYLSGIPATDPLNAPAETIKNPGTISERLARVGSAMRTIETARVLIAWHGSVLAEAVRQSPETLDGLPEDQQRQVRELIGRISLESNDD
jgi:hypothetical protein